MTQKEALEILKLGGNVYLTGSAGSGKTHLLNQYIDYLRKHDVEVAVTASTGIAATHMNGVTIHSWSGLGIRDSISDAELDELEEKKYLWNRFEQTKVLVIDEISMLHHFRLDLVDRVCRFFKRNDAPFGGLQVVLCGDFFQLPPVSRSYEEDAQFAYRSETWQNMDLQICYLHEQFRQNDANFLEVLAAIRARNVSEATRDHLRSRYQKEPEVAARATKLYTHNVDVDAINEAELMKLKTPLREFRMSDKGRGPLVETLKKSCLAPETLRIKEGAQVMFVKNNFEAGYANGTLGKVVGFEPDGGVPIVETVSGKRIVASPIEWKIDEAGKTLAELTQVPLRLAWAITVHKSQGMSLDAVEVDLSKSFEMGMGYVALSRVRSLSGLKLLGINEMALAVHPEVFEFDQVLQQRSEESKEKFSRLSASERQARQKAFLEMVGGKKKGSAKKLPTHHETKLLLEKKMSLRNIAKERELTVDTVLDHIEKLQKEGVSVPISHLKAELLPPARFKKIKEAFEKAAQKDDERRLAPVKNALGPNFTYVEIRLARLFLDA